MILDLLKSAGPDRNSEIVQKVMSELDLRVIDQEDDFNLALQEHTRLYENNEAYRQSHRRYQG